MLTKHSLVTSYPTFLLIFRKFFIAAWFQDHWSCFFLILLQSSCQQDNTTLNNLITTSSLTICMLETGSCGGEGGGRKWWENRKQFGGKAGMDRETIAERWNCFQREGRCNNKHKGWRNYQKERRDMGADQSWTQQITFTAAAESIHRPLTALSHTRPYRSWSHDAEFVSHTAPTASVHDPVPDP